MGPFSLRKCAFYLFSVAIFLAAAIEITVVLGEFYKIGFAYYSHLVAALFITFNLLGNLIYCYSTDCNVMKSPAWHPFRHENEPSNWSFCEKCNILRPPRAWHCNLCKVCILKRDHHCLMTGRCVGHNNYRYFLVFLVYGVVAVFYAVYLNIVYIFWCNTNFFDNLLAKICTFHPPILLLKYYIYGEAPQVDWSCIMIPMFSTIFAAGVVANILLYQHSSKFLIGATYHEGQRTRYNLGSWMSNLQTVLGKRYILVWIAPFFSSELPCDGVNWDNEIVEPQKQVENKQNT